MGLTNNLGKLSNMITSTGTAVGIGTTTPAELVEVSAPAVAGTSQQARLRITQAGSISARANLVSGVISGENPYFAIETRQSASPFSIVERLRIDGNGNVGIGQTSPSYALDVANSSSPSLRVRNGALGGTATLLLETANDFSGTCQTYIKCIGTTSNGTSQLAFGTAGASGDSTATERMRITSGGRVWINTTSSLYSTAAQMEFQWQGASVYGINMKTTTGDGLPLNFINSSGTQVGYVYTTTNSTQYSTTSDYRLKEDLKDFNGLNLIGSLKMYDYQWKSDKSRMHGVLAHELKEIIPYAVSGEKDGDRMQGVDYSLLVPILVKAIQELNAKVSALENKS